MTKSFFVVIVQSKKQILTYKTLFVQHTNILVGELCYKLTWLRNLKGLGCLNAMVLLEKETSR